MEKQTPQPTEKNNKVALSIKVDPAIYAAVSQMASDEDRSMSNTVERLLKSHPQIENAVDATA